jgi:NodT family efflux transporter outer membrane factor (OMF) lipoprotein
MRDSPLIVCLAVIAALLDGCAAGPNYHSPKTEVGTGFANGDQARIALGRTDIDWWRGFHDPELDGLVERALAANHDLRIATARVREARALRAQAVADVLPVLQGDAGYNKSLSSLDAVPFPLTRRQRELQLFNAGFDATWELDLFGHVRRSIEAARADLAATEANRQATMISLIAEVARNYFELRGVQNELDVARRNADNQRETLDLSVAKLRAGRATEFDTARARAQVNATLAAIPPLEAAIKHSIYRLGVLTGGQPIAPESELERPSPISELPVLVNIGNPADLLRRRPDIHAAERALAAATARIGVETSDLFPRVVFNGNLGFAATHLSGLGKAGTDTYSFGPQITWAALDLGHVRARMRAAHARADAELAAYEKTVLIALEETENALVDFGREQVRRDYLRESVSSAAEAVALAKQRYEGGVADFLPVLDAQRTQLDVEAQLARSQTRTATSLVAVYKSLGGGWENADALAAQNSK